jgi:GAF domain-containing protein
MGTLTVSAGARYPAARPALPEALRALTGRIGSADRLDDDVAGLSREICEVFEADRMTIYARSGDGRSIVSRVRAGLDGLENIELPISESSVAGFCALHRRHLNIRDAYDESELRRLSPNLVFRRAVDQFTGYRSRQMLVTPILGDDAGGEVLGVLQLINSLSGRPFTLLHDVGAMELARALASVLRPAHGPEPAQGTNDKSME